MTTSSRHHFVPQGFLRAFAAADTPGRAHIWVYSKAPGRLPRRKAIRSIAWLRDYYSQDGADGAADDRLEVALARNVDGIVPPMIARLAAVPHAPMAMTDEERGNVAYFIGLSLTRVPNFRDGIEAAHAWAARSMLSHMANTDASVASFVSQYDPQVKVKTWASLKGMLEAAQLIADSVMAKRWQFFVAPADVPLVTSDNPVHFSGAYAGHPVGPANPRAEVIMNLRKDLALVCTPREDAPTLYTFPLTPSEARKFNRGTVRAARERVFASENSPHLDAFVKKYAETSQQLVA